MAKYFSRKKYQKDIVSRDTFAKWKEANPKYKDLPYSVFLDYWHHLRTEIFTSIGENPAGVDLPFFMGNLSVKIIDIDFKCAKDFLTSRIIDKETKQPVRIPFVGSEIPKKAKIAWVKHKLFKSLPSIFMVEACRTMKQAISATIREKGVDAFQKAFDLDKVKSKCEPEKELNPFDQFYDN